MARAMYAFLCLVNMDTVSFSFAESETDEVIQ